MPLTYESYVDKLPPAKLQQPVEDKDLDAIAIVLEDREGIAHILDLPQQMITSDLRSQRYVLVYFLELVELQNLSQTS